MSIYQVLDEENNPMGEYLSFEKAINSAEEMTFWEEEHYFHVESIELEES